MKQLVLAARVAQKCPTNGTLHLLSARGHAGPLLRTGKTGKRREEEEECGGGGGESKADLREEVGKEENKKKGSVGAFTHSPTHYLIGLRRRRIVHAISRGLRGGIRQLQVQPIQDEM